MSVRSGGSFGTLLMSVPLAAIPLMAIFGIPQFAPVAASPDDEEITLGEPQSERGGRDYHRRRSSDLLDRIDDRERPGPLSDAPVYDPFREEEEAIQEPADRGRQRRRAAIPESASPAGTADRSHSQALHATRNRTPERNANDWFNAADAADNTTELPESATPRSRAADGAGRFTETGVREVDTPTQLTWREAARELSDRGIESYRLERGHDAESFLFVGTLTPGDAPHVIMRFEAEAVEPLAAVSNVLDQVDAWLRGRFAAGRDYPAGADETQ